MFSLIDDDSFGYTESEDRIQKTTVRESPENGQAPEQKKIDNSQRLERKSEGNSFQNTENQENKIKRIVLFYENGKFESFEP